MPSPWVSVLIGVGPYRLQSSFKVLKDDGQTSLSGRSSVSSRVSDALCPTSGICPFGFTSADYFDWGLLDRGSWITWGLSNYLNLSYGECSIRNL